MKSNKPLEKHDLYHGSGESDAEVMRHSCEHVMASVLMKLWSNTKRGVGPAIENGFYQDFEIDNYSVTPEDLPKIEKEMIKIKNQKLPFEKLEMGVDEAIEFCKKEKQQYKVEILSELKKQGEKKVTFYKTGEYIDLCRGPHVADTSKIGFFKLTRLAGAYWRGDEKNKMLQRIYGVSFPTAEELDKYLWQQEEAKKRDHRKLGKELDLFIIPEEVGSGLLIWTPKGATIRREIEKLIITEQIKRGYQHVNTPHIGKKSLWVTSGHWDLYRDKMYAPMKIDNIEYLVKPMNCPMHMMVYKNHIRSYRDLPIRIAEDATVYRYEQAGELAGMFRVRYITQDDSHIFCKPDQVVDEFVGVVDYITFLLKTFNITDFTFRLSLRDNKNKDKYLGEDKIWEEAEETIEKALKKTGLPYYKEEGEAAFYGPKVDVMIRDALGREWQCGTVQVDFMLPDRFKLEYVDKDGTVKRPVLIHRAPLGSLERFTGILIEHYGGAFPVWLAPVQATIIPIAERHNTYAQKVYEKLMGADIRAEVDLRSESMQSKIRDAQKQKIPYMLVVGDREEKNGEVAVRLRNGENLGAITVEKFTEQILETVAKRA